ncbi:MAG TPA: DUF4332 domain-containing protein [Thermoplasmatales archaeon]|nr:DUF4332 domain-containing protein [Thermoplasmatales archaeon]
MNKSNSWMFSFIFFVFLSSFVAAKAVFILFFQASFDPPFILQLTPLYLLPAVNNLQLFLFSLIVVVFDAYLHIKDTRRNLLYSLIPTLIMLSGVSSVIIMNEFSVEYTVHYLLFLFLLVILVVDHRRTLPAIKEKVKPMPSKAFKHSGTRVFHLPSFAFVQPSSSKRISLGFTSNKPLKPSKKEQEIEDALKERIKNRSYSKKEKKTLLSEVEMISDLCRLDDLTPSHADVLIDAGFRSLKELSEGDPYTIFKVFSDKERLPSIGVTMERVERWVDSAKTFIEQEKSQYLVDSPKYLNRE